MMIEKTGKVRANFKITVIITMNQLSGGVFL